MLSGQASKKTPFNTQPGIKTAVAATVGFPAWGFLPVSNTTLVCWPAMEMLMLYVDWRFCKSTDANLPLDRLRKDCPRPDGNLLRAIGT